MYVAMLREMGRPRFELRRTVPREEGLGFEVLADNVQFIRVTYVIRIGGSSAAGQVC